MDGKIYEYESLIYEAGETGGGQCSGDCQGTGIKEGLEDVDMSEVWAYF